MPVKNAARIHERRSALEFEARRQAMLSAYADWLYTASPKDAADAIEATTRDMRQLLALRDDAPP